MAKICGCAKHCCHPLSKRITTIIECSENDDGSPNRPYLFKRTICGNCKVWISDQIISAKENITAIEKPNSSVIADDFLYDQQTQNNLTNTNISD
ncbi:MAG TPA: hypothetical protein PK367_01345 [Candidatus Paceibacterota bacterium]|nr:hypothetical protein [Candidatus Paceibacterota bacterium]